MEHNLRIVSSHDVQAVCTCGKWRFISPGALTQDTNVRMEEEFQRHLLNYHQHATRAEERVCEAQAEEKANEPRLTLKQWKERLRPGLQLRCVYRWYWHTENQSKPAPPEGFQMCEILTVRATQCTYKTPDSDKPSWMHYPRASELKATAQGFEMYFPNNPKWGARAGILMSRYEYVTP